MAALMIINFHSLELEFRKRLIFAKFSNVANCVVVSAELATGLLPDSIPEVFHGEDLKSITLTWPSFGNLVIHHLQHENGVEYKMEWTHCKPTGKLRDSVLMQGAYWYGAAHSRLQHWPIEKWSRPEAAYVTGDSFQNDYGGVMERYWLSSNGVVVFVDADIPLFIGMNIKDDNILSLGARWSSPYKNVKDTEVRLSYRIFIAENVRIVHELATAKVFSKPEAIPDELMFRYPIWSTWARYKKNINQDIVMEFAREIKNNDFKVAQLEIDDDWTKRYGDHDFDENKFPDAKKMIEDLNELGFRVTVWVHPFASPMSQAASTDFWVKSSFLPGHTIWWNGIAKILDVTNPEAVSFFKHSMSKLKEKYNLASFKFDAGESNWLPSFASPKIPWSNPNEYSTKYAQMCYECDPAMRALEVRVGCGTQHLPVFVRMMDKDSTWGFDNGLRSLIPHVLTFSVLGYSFVLPDMIGGNAYGKLGAIGPSSNLPEKELFIRWLQANVFLPSLQFSLCPWQYDDPEVLEISKAMTELHEQFADTFITLAHESVQTGVPIIRPMWWLAPNDESALTADDQFLVGNNIVVAPIVVKGATSRDVYLPPGKWTDVLHEKVLEGEKMHTDIEATLQQLPYFTRLNEQSANALEEEVEVAGQNDVEENIVKADVNVSTKEETAATVDSGAAVLD